METTKMSTKPIRVEYMDWKWLILNRGMGSIPDKIHELIQDQDRIKELEGLLSDAEDTIMEMEG